MRLLACSEIMRAYAAVLADVPIQMNAISANDTQRSAMSFPAREYPASSRLSPGTRVLKSEMKLARLSSKVPNEILVRFWISWNWVYARIFHTSIRRWRVQLALGG